jgi:hypothetical protein
VIHIPSVTFPCNSSYEVIVNGFGFQRTVLFDSETGSGFGVSVPSLGNYKLNYSSKDCSLYGFLTPGGRCAFSVSANNDNVYTNANTDEISGCLPPPTELFPSTDVFTMT